MLVGHIRGGLGIVTILGCMFFASMIGSGPGTVAAMGSIMIPSMIKRGYSPEYAAGVSATGGTLGILIPPSNPMLVYGIIANVSISALFTAGFVPGALGRHLPHVHGLYHRPPPRLQGHDAFLHDGRIRAGAPEEHLVPHGSRGHPRRHLRGHMHAPWKPRSSQCGTPFSSASSSPRSFP